jgi:alpha-methylacyl-CoA racemase
VIDSPPTATPASDRTVRDAGPLSGLRVIELASIGPVPLCGMLLADLGADVIRVDRVKPSGLGLDLQRRFDVNGRGRRSIALDLKHPSARDVVLRLVTCSDLLIEGFRPGVTEGLGLGPQDCHAINPGLVYGRMTGYGQTGPLAQAAGHDLNYVALTGVLNAIGSAGGAPVPPLNLVGDYGGGALYLAFGVMAALFERQRSGLGQVVDAAMVDGAASLASIFFGLQSNGQWLGQRGNNLLDGGAPFYSTYRTADDRYVSLGPLEPKFFAILVAALGIDSVYVERQYDRAVWPQMRQAIAEAIVRRTRDEWVALLEGTDVCFAPVLSFDEASAHPHARARGSFVEVEGVTQPAPAPRFDRTPALHPQRAPEIGEHTDDMLHQLGFSAEDVRALRQAGIAL